MDFKLELPSVGAALAAAAPAVRAGGVTEADVTDVVDAGGKLKGSKRPGARMLAGKAAALKTKPAGAKALKDAKAAGGRASRVR